MARTRAELEKLKAEIEDELQSADSGEDYDIWVESDGVKFTLKGPEKAAFLRKHSKLWEEAKEEAEEELEETKEEKPEAKKTVARKRAVAKPKLEETVEEELEDDPAPEAPKTFWG